MFPRQKGQGLIKGESCSSDFPFYLWWRCVAKCKNRSWCWQFCPFLIPGWHFGALSSTLCEEQCLSRGIRQRPACVGVSQEKRKQKSEQFIYLGGDILGWILHSWNWSQRNESWEWWERRLGTGDIAKSSPKESVRNIILDDNRNTWLLLQSFPTSTQFAWQVSTESCCVRLFDP